MSCDCCKKRKPVKDPEVLGIKGFKPNMFVCQDCIDWLVKIQEARKE